jgi:DNA polymerase-3 subunit delta'
MNRETRWPAWLDAPLARGLALRGHAILVHAAGDAGQFELAQALARAWLCESPLQGQACGRCVACHLMAAHAHPDCHVLLPDALRERLGWQQGSADEEPGGDAVEAGKGKSKPSREIRIAPLRAAIDWGRTTPARGVAKVLVIHPASAMNAVTANALLKTLEEPPGRLRLVLTVDDPEALLPTVRSRCQRLPIAGPTAEEGAAWLAAQGVAQPEVLLAAAGGLPPAALALHADGIDAAVWAGLPATVRQGRADAVAGWPVPRVVEGLHKLCHDLLACAAGGAPRYFAAAALAPALRPAPTLAALVAWQRALVDAARHEDHPWNTSLRIEALVAQGGALWQTPRASTSGRGGPLATLPGR